MNRKTLLGPLFILLGVFMFMKGGRDFDVGTIFAYFWPTLFVIPVGVFFHWLYFSMLQRRGVGVLVPGGVLLTAGIVCQIAMLFDLWDVMWPGFIFAAAVGLFELYWFGGRNKWLWIPINVLTVVSLLFFAIFSVGKLLGSLFHGQPIFALALVVIGCLILFPRRKDTF
ncbi:hypothetical protein ACFPVX_08855 [Cohnella faecalis]|uniref:DUF5668 domain-containing protein n=1 Tax=Cohnella faecalis TaxID=2315694 RepID=A0A398CH66_9BACL|nr:hypothetical protein [Cohnella faecalis]RIE01810.1 hypothetical protein D3H35_13530 [Cohnella faecalis]